MNLSKWGMINIGILMVMAVVIICMAQAWCIEYPQCSGLEPDSWVIKESIYRPLLFSSTIFFIIGLIQISLSKTKKP